MNEAQIRKTANLECVRASPGIQRRAFQNWLSRAADLAKYPYIIFVHCDKDKLASWTDMVLLADTISALGGNVLFCTLVSPITISIRSFGTC